MSLKKLIAFDAEDLAILSAYVQDACLSAGDMIYLPREQRFAFVAERFVREAGSSLAEKRPVGMHFERVSKVRSHGITPGGEGKLQLLAIQFKMTEAPSGTMCLVFAGGGEISLEVECLEAFMSDLGEGGPKQPCPSHALK
jgi:hypothetical protein